MKKQLEKTVIALVQDDITELDTDAIVNAANGQLAHGSGVAGAIVKKGGTVIQEESDTWVLARGGSIPTGTAAITGGGALKARYVIHAVGPRMGEGDEDAKLRAATESALKMADDHMLHSIAFPAISTGIFGYPLDRCARIMLSTAIDYIQGETLLELVVFCLYSNEAFDQFLKTFEELI